mmetsp:Transcript_7580/g.13241  ORF Transcript_7580/g.13241 Transcript_7580/m.13241 type:complete len:121 (-) Transcript_7580:323-685(-)
MEGAEKSQSVAMLKNSSLSVALEDTLDQMVKDRLLDEKQANRVREQFELSASAGLSQIRRRVATHRRRAETSKIIGNVTSFSLLNGVGTFHVEDATVQVYDYGVLKSKHLILQTSESALS